MDKHIQEQLDRIELLKRWILGEIEIDVKNPSFMDTEWSKVRDDYRENYFPEVRIHEKYKPPEKVYVIIHKRSTPPYNAYLNEYLAWGRVDRDDEETLVLEYILNESNS